MAGNSCKWLEMARIGWKWMEKAGMSGNGWKRLEIARTGCKLLKKKL